MEKDIERPDDLIERIAIAICPWHDGSHDKSVDWKYMAEVVKQAYREQAKAAIDAMPKREIATVNIDELILAITKDIEGDCLTADHFPSGRKVLGINYIRSAIERHLTKLSGVTLTRRIT